MPSGWLGPGIVTTNRGAGGFGSDCGDPLVLLRVHHERLPPSPAPSRSMAGLHSRSFLYGPAHRSQMLAKAQGGRLPALRKVVAKPYLAAQ